MYQWKITFLSMSILWWLYKSLTSIYFNETLYMYLLSGISIAVPHKLKSKCSHMFKSKTSRTNHIRIYDMEVEMSGDKGNKKHRRGAGKVKDRVLHIEYLHHKVECCIWSRRRLRGGSAGHTIAWAHVPDHVKYRRVWCPRLTLPRAVGSQPGCTATLKRPCLSD